MLVALSTFGDSAQTSIEILLGPWASYSVQVLRIIWLDILLAGDNAVVIALACRTLPARQRRMGIVLGAAAAVAMRIMFTLVISRLFGVHWLKLAGGCMLLWIAVKLLSAGDDGSDEVRGGTSMWEAVRIVAIADMVMSLDNVLAVAAAAHGDQTLIVLGLVVSIPLVVAGATVITSLLNRFPILVWAGAALLGWVAGELIASEPALRPAMDQLGMIIGAAPSVLADHPPASVTRLIEVMGASLVCAVGYLVTRGKQHRAET